MNNKTCTTCLFSGIDPYDNGLRCVNYESDNCTEWVNEDDTCEYWEEKADEE